MKIAFALALLSSAPLVSHAAMVQFQYQSTIQYPNPSANIAAGDDLFITITLDNGGGIENGVWGTEHVETITYQVGSGEGVFSHTFDTTSPSYTWSGNLGQFSTDQNGELVTVPSEWVGGTGNTGFYINAYNAVFYGEGVDLFDSNVERNTTVQGWGGTVVPEPSAALLGSLGALALLRRRRG